jgi:hypothetical protein
MGALPKRRIYSNHSRSREKKLNSQCNKGEWGMEEIGRVNTLKQGIGYGVLDKKV